MGRPYKCRSCGGTNTIWKGYRKVVGGKVRIRKCKDCGKKFTTRQRAVK